MKTKTIYYIILLVYMLLWACQLVLCQLTHSLVILTDSYINLYKILEISLGLLHLCTQHEQTRSQLAGAESTDALKTPALAGRVFNCICTYQFKRLPLLGSFMNGLFLAALLMSAAIEGIQTCVHSRHSENDNDQSVLHRDQLTYPIILTGFALVGIIMQHCSLKAHESREEELQSESLLDIRRNEMGSSSRNQSNQPQLRELSANNLHDQDRRSSSSGKRRSYDLNLLRKQTPSSVNRNRKGNASLQDLPMSLAEAEIANNRENRISLKSLKVSTNLESIASENEKSIGTISHDLEAPVRVETRGKSSKDRWFIVSLLTSPVALLVYAAINYFVADDLLTEIFDATLSICVVLILFVASYSPMVRYGRVLLQTAPDGVDLVKLEKDLMCSSKHILEVNNLHVWSLTPRSNRVATCQLVLDKDFVNDEKQIKLVISEAKYKLLDQNIRCTTIEPVLKHREVATE